jgi:hypothetical protein
MMKAQCTLFFSSDYLHQDHDDPMTALAKVPRELKARVLFQRALEVYGHRMVGLIGPAFVA